MRAIGLMSGTSMDGIDVAMIETDGERLIGFGPSATYPYRGEEAVLRRAAEAAQGLRHRAERPGVLAEAEALVTRLHAAAVGAFLDAARIDRATVDLVGFHGQTVLHRPERRLTVQLGDGAALAREIGLPVAYDFRAADVAAGGEGAPLVPVFPSRAGSRASSGPPDRGAQSRRRRQLTVIDGEAIPSPAIPPGNRLIDDFLARAHGVARDQDGRTGPRGVSTSARSRGCSRIRLARPCPKSLDRNDFSRLGFCARRSCKQEHEDAPRP